MVKNTVATTCCTVDDHCTAADVQVSVTVYAVTLGININCSAADGKNTCFGIIGFFAVVRAFFRFLCCCSCCLCVSCILVCRHILTVLHTTAVTKLHIAVHSAEAAEIIAAVAVDTVITCCYIDRTARDINIFAFKAFIRIFNCYCTVFNDKVFICMNTVITCFNGNITVCDRYICVAVDTVVTGIDCNGSAANCKICACFNTLGAFRIGIGGSSIILHEAASAALIVIVRDSFGCAAACFDCDCTAVDDKILFSLNTIVSRSDIDFSAFDINMTLVGIIRLRISGTHTVAILSLNSYSTATDIEVIFACNTMMSRFNIHSTACDTQNIFRSDTIFGITRYIQCAFAEYRQIVLDIYCRIRVITAVVIFSCGRFGCCGGFGCFLFDIILTVSECIGRTLFKNEDRLVAF